MRKYSVTSLHKSDKQPLSIKKGMESARCRGIEFESPDAFISAGKATAIVLEKEGVITDGNYVVTDVISADFYYRNGYALLDASDDELLTASALLDKNSDHPLAKAITKYSREILFDVEEEVTDFKAFNEFGTEGRIGNSVYRSGSPEYISRHCRIPVELEQRVFELSKEGKICVFYAKDKKLLGIIGVSDSLKKDSQKAINELKELGIRVIMLSSDNEVTAKAIGDQAGVSEVITDYSPDKKKDIIKELEEKGEIVIACDEHLEGAGFTTGRDSLLDVIDAITLARKVIRLKLIYLFEYYLHGGKNSGEDN